MIRWIAMMRWIAPVFLIALCCPAADELALQVEAVAPKVVKPGDSVVISGVALDDAHVETVYLTDHKFDMQCKILEQNAKTIKFRIPPFAKPGRMQLLILTKQTKTEDPLLLELPAYLLIQEASTEVGELQPGAKAKKGNQKP